MIIEPNKKKGSKEKSYTLYKYMKQKLGIKNINTSYRCKKDANPAPSHSKYYYFFTLNE